MVSLANAQTSTSVCEATSTTWFPQRIVTSTRVDYTESFVLTDNRDMITGMHYCVETDASGAATDFLSWII